MKDAWLNLDKPFTNEELEMLDALLAKLSRNVTEEEANKVFETRMLLLNQRARLANQAG